MDDYCDRCRGLRAMIVAHVHEWQLPPDLRDEVVEYARSIGRRPKVVLEAAVRLLLARSRAEGVPAVLRAPAWEDDGLPLPEDGEEE